jgi:hypothetical protein
VNQIVRTIAIAWVMAFSLSGTPSMADWLPRGSDQINIYSDANFTSKEALDNVPGTLTVFIVHEPTPWTLATWFKITPSNGFTGMWLSETTPFLFLGTSPTGIQIAYGTCLEGPTLVLEVTYSVFGTSEPCSYLEVGAHPEMDCGGPYTEGCPYFEMETGIGGRLTINPTPQCSPAPVEPSTWGRVKALYR